MFKRKKGAVTEPNSQCLQKWLSSNRYLCCILFFKRLNVTKDNLKPSANLFHK